MNSLSRIVLVACLLCLASGVARAKAPDGWGFIDYNEAVVQAKQKGKAMFVYFGFATCPYCLYLNQHTLSSDALRKRYSDHYVLAYFDIRGNPNDMITLPGGDKLTRAEAIKRLKGSPVPAWGFVAPDGKEILMRRGSRTKVAAFMQFDAYVSNGAYKQDTFAEFLARNKALVLQPEVIVELAHVTIARIAGKCHYALGRFLFAAIAQRRCQQRAGG